MTIDAGTNVSFSNFKTHKVKVNVTGSSQNFTVINILNSGTVYVPQVTSYNGRALDQSEEGADMPIIFNFPNASQVVITDDMSPSYGHILAPNANVKVEGGNYNGIVICQNLDSRGEGHPKNYHGPLPTPPIYNIGFDKVSGIGTTLAGATLEILDASGNSVISFTSTDSTFIYPLEVGTYTLHEVSAPDGFQLASDVSFRVNNDGSITYGGQTASGPVTMTDQPEPVTAELAALTLLLSVCINSFKQE